jgi:ribosomal protein L32
MATKKKSTEPTDAPAVVPCAVCGTELAPESVCAVCGHPAPKI